MLELLIVFLWAFIAASLLPVSSEIAVIAHYHQYPQMVIELFLIASAGNILGSVVNWYLGLYCLRWPFKKWFPFSKAQIVKGQYWFQRYGKWSLLLAWLPVVGDVLTVAAGMAKCRLSLFLLLVSIAKAGRYAILLLFTSYVT